MTLSPSFTNTSLTVPLTINARSAVFFAFTIPDTDTLFSYYASDATGMFIRNEPIDGKMNFVIYSASSTPQIAASTTSTWTDGQWYHIVATWGAGGVNLYVNGKLENTTAYYNSFIIKGQDNHYTFSPSIGNSCDNYYNDGGTCTAGYNNPAYATIDELRIYNRQLTNTEIKSHYYSGLANITTLGTEETQTQDTYYNYSIIYDMNVYETENDIIEAIYLLPEPAVMTGKLNWNSTDYSITGTNTSPTLWNFNGIIIPNLVDTTTNVNFNWNMTLTYPNGTVLTNQTTTIL